MATNRCPGLTRKHRRAYFVWYDMIRRCYNTSLPNYHLYGGRGITVCTEWRDAFAAFLRDMGDPPAGLSIDRRDNDGPYCKSNCRWATVLEQNYNRSIAKIISYNGKSMSISDWAKTLGISYVTLWTRICKVRMPLAKALQAQLLPRGGGAHLRGSRMGNAKLDEEKVLVIRARLAAGETQTAVAASLGVSSVIVSLVHNRKRWRHVQ